MTYRIKSEKSYADEFKKISDKALAQTKQTIENAGINLPVFNQKKSKTKRMV